VRYAVLQADIVTTVAEHMNASVVGLGISPEKITAIPFGVDTQFFVPANPATSQHVPLKLVCTRSFASIYDVGTLVRALAKVFIGGRQLEVELVGDGPLRQSLVGLVQELGLSRSVRFCGHVEPKKLAELLAKADIFVSPALSDGNNVSLTEAMACGCFPIATDIPANAQWIKDGQTGYLYPPGNVDRLVEAIDGAMNNPALRQSAKLENRRIVEMQADWRISVKRMEGIYQRLCGNKSIQHES
jgi:glycosyltransferase involved in cell wall biosynthesis